MKAEFNITRELENKLVYGKGKCHKTDIHFHSHMEVYFILSGKVEVSLNSQRRILSRGEGAVALSYDAHGYKAVEEAEVFYAIIPRSWSAAILPMLESKIRASQFITNEKAFEVILNAIEGLKNEQNDVSVRGYIYVMLGAILDAIEDVSENEPSSDAFAPEILIYISNHYKEELSLVSLAKKFGYNPSYLSHSFRQNFGMPFCKYITMLRLREAVMRISNRDASITTCAIESGFGSMRSFYRAFKDEFGVSPKEYFQ